LEADRTPPFYNAVDLLEEKICRRFDRAVRKKRVGRQLLVTGADETTTLINWMNTDRHWTFSGLAEASWACGTLSLELGVRRGRWEQSMHRPREEMMSGETDLTSRSPKGIRTVQQNKSRRELDMASCPQFLSVRSSKRRALLSPAAGR